MLRLAENPRDRVAGFRVLQLLPGIGPATAGAGCSTAIGDALDAAIGAVAALGRRRAPRQTGRRFVDAVSPALRAGQPAGRPSSSRSRRWYEPHLERIHEDAAARRADLLQLEQIAARLPLARALPHRADARSAGRDQRRGRAAATATRTT